MTALSSIYVGDVVHQRHRPRAHRLRYRVFSMLLDLDELPDLDRRLRLFGYNRSRPISFWDKDVGDGGRDRLRHWVEGHLIRAHIDTADLHIRMLCYPRILGYVFNPLTVYFCERRDGELVAILYEVSNTFGERHTYVIPVHEGSTQQVRHSCRKEMYVSPFVPMDCVYRFRVERPADKVMIAIDEADAAGPLLYASFAGKRRPLSDAALAWLLVSLPLMTIKIIAGIHWEALRLWLKGVPIYRRVASANRRASSLIRSEE